MSIHYEKGRAAWRFSFKRIVNNKLLRATKLLPKDWTRAQAEAFDTKETARLLAQESGLAHSRPRIEDAVLVYLTEHVPELKTAEDYIAEYQRLYPMYEGRFLDELPLVCREINKLSVSPATRRNKIRMLCAACNYGYKFHSMGDSLPSARVQVPKVSNQRVVYPSRKEMLTIARKVKRRDARAALICAFYSGMRQGEIRRAIIQDFEFRLYDSKNGDVRFIPLHPKLYVYAKEFPLAIERFKLYYQWKQARNAAGLKHLHFHDVRHSAATEMLNNDVPLSVVGEVLGHRDSRSTRRYAHMLTATMLKAIKQIGKRKETV